ncbi:MAG: DNA methyltransferase [Candidatus Bathyarchaeia archaeon]
MKRARPIMAQQAQLINRLNDLSGKEWMLFTKSWFILNPSPRGLKALHPACYPEELASAFIQFFTKRDDWILDPFLGSGTTLVAAKRAGRNSVGIEVYKKYAQLTKDRLSQIDGNGTKSQVYAGDSRNITSIFKANKLPFIDFCLTSPPYWNQLRQNHRRQRSRTEMGLSTSYGKSKLDLANIDDYDEFLRAVVGIFDGVHNVMAKNSYLVLVCNNVYRNGRVFPLAYDLFRMLSKKWIPKDERIWCQDNKSLYPFGIYCAWVANRCHHYCFVFKRAD